MELHHWARRTKDIISNFQLILFNHIYRELNSEANGLSKLVLGEDMENIAWELIMGGSIIEHGLLSMLNFHMLN